MDNKPFTPCPICNRAEVSNLLHTRDYSLTQATFDIIECAFCGLKYTYPIPPADKIAPYYDFPEYISHTDVKSGWMNKLYHYIRNKTLLQKANWVQSLFTGHKGKLLEIGAGTGAFANTMVQKKWEVTALEPDENSRNIAFEKYNIALRPIDHLFTIDTLSQDVICLWHVLEHVHDLQGYMNAFNAILKPTGKLIIAVPNHTSYDANFYKEYWAAFDVPRHLYHFSPSSMKVLLKKYNFQLVEVKPMWYDSFYVSILSEKYKQTGIMGIFRAFFVGCISNLKALSNPDKASSLIYVIKKKD